MPGLSIDIEIQKDSNLADLDKVLTATEEQEFATQLAGDYEQLTREHIVSASKTRHKTAEKLGANPSQYLLNKASSVEAVGTPGQVLLSVAGEIFKRTFQPVTVNAVNAKMLTIPWRAEAYGRRAREFDGLFVYKSKGGQGPSFLAQRDGGRMKFLFLLKRTVVLPQDRGLLPSEKQFADVAEESAVDYVDAQVKNIVKG